MCKNEKRKIRFAQQVGTYNNALYSTAVYLYNKKTVNKLYFLQLIIQLQLHNIYNKVRKKTEFNVLPHLRTNY